MWQASIKMRSVFFPVRTFTCIELNERANMHRYFVKIPVFAFRRSSLILAIASIAACGGGGGGGYGQPDTGGNGNANRAPMWTSMEEAVDITEGTDVVEIVATASDADGDTLSFSVSGSDSELFSTTTSGGLRFNTPPDYEAPTDSDGNNVYEVTLEASDGLSTASISILITVLDVNESGDEDGAIITGIVVAGTYLASADVFQDLDADLEIDSNEPTVKTDEFGRFSLNVTDLSAGEIVSIGGVTPETGADYGGQFVLRGGVASETPLLITPIGSLLNAAASSSEISENSIIAALRVDQSSLRKDPLQALGEAASEAENIATNQAQLSILLKTLSEVIQAKTSNIEEFIAKRAAATATKLNFSNVQLLADVTADLDNEALNLNITDVTGALGRFLQQVRSPDEATLSTFVDVGLRVVASDILTIAAGDSTLAASYRNNVLSVIEAASALTDLESTLPNFKEFSYRIDEGASSGFQYTIDGTDAKTSEVILYARVGDTIRFDNVINLNSHPFRLGTAPESSPLTEEEGVVISNNHHVALVVNEKTPPTIYPYCQVHSNMFERGRILIVNSFSEVDLSALGQSPLQVRGVVLGGKYDGAAGFTYDVYLSQSTAESSSSDGIHEHSIVELPEVPFYMPNNQGYHGAKTSSERTTFKPMIVNN